jgi:signal peptidase I
MADVNNPQVPSSARNITTPASVNGAPTGAGQPLAAPLSEETPPSRTIAHELVMSARWLAGLVAVLAIGWGLIAFVCYMFYLAGHESKAGLGIPAAIASILSLFLFLAVERKQYLSRFMGLRQFKNDAYGIKSALYLWLLGVPGMLFRSTEALDAEAEAETHPGARPAKAAPEPQQTDGVREIIETIVFVVVLVLLLKSFAAEAFVIPTGSMAETLYGYQRIIKCPQCGREFPVNCSTEVDPSQGNRQEKITGCTCPGCRYHIDFQDEEQKDPNWKEPDWNSGDRVLVAKFLYELFNKQPNRLDVVVFKYPGDSHTGALFPRSGPIKNQTPMNYIKRLIGLSGETIAIHRGKLYVLPPGEGIKYDDWEHAQTDPDLRIRLWQWQYMHVNDAVPLFDKGKFTIIRKPPESMLAMRRLVYSNDQQAKDLKNVLPPRWFGEQWQEDGTGFKIADAGDATQWLHYRHFLRGFEDKQDALAKDHFHPLAARSLITDFMGYNTYETHGGRNRPGENWVGDLMLECEVTVDNNVGEFVMELSKSRDRFQMKWNLATGNIDLVRLTTKEQKTEEMQLASKQATQPKKGSTYLVRFANVDNRLTVWVDSKLPFDDGVTYLGPTEQFAGPVAENDLEPASIGAKGAPVTVRKLCLYRDTYYTASINDSPSAPDAGTAVDFSNKDTWDPLSNSMPVKTMYVQPDHFLCLGDNSPESSDGRIWGLVPERLLLGRAMLVYYPFGRGGRIR